ncbi:MAG: helix-turn-helix domain-containing protein [Chitinivibrionales bacterium]|nr:helix-turn-helix domain-containing protein [Chitinivibrionales bacterium]MBD3396182.1 helix-turn-helix domain-containing protein [Chitinivibrionales bacterium]
MKIRRARSAQSTPERIPDIMDVEQSARYLGVSKRTMYQLIHHAHTRVPVKRIAGAFKISRRQLLDWFESL